MSDETKQRAPGGIRVYLTGVALVAAVLLGLTVLVRAQRSSAQSDREAREAEMRAGPRVSVIAVRPSSTERRLRLLGEARPFFETTLYAKLTGYLRAIRVDRGDRVRAGEILALVESPETEQQYRAARIEAHDRAMVASRYRELQTPGIISRQDAERAETNRREAEANVSLLAATRGYRALRAPFDGTVTARFADVGALVQANSQAVVRVSQVDRLRVFAYLEQRDATLVHVGDGAEVALAERPEVRVTAQVARLAGELDSRTRTLLTEIDVDNRDGRITPGSFVQVVFRFTAPSYPEVPSEALVLRGARPFVAVIDGDNRVRFRAVEIIDDDGQRAQLASGAQIGERVAVGLGDEVQEGSRVQPVMSPVSEHASGNGPASTARGGHAQ